jgi:hypothetical protein
VIWALLVTALFLGLALLAYRRARAEDKALSPFVAQRSDLCRKAAEALIQRPGKGWVPEMAPLTIEERAIVWAMVQKARAA